MRPPFELGWQTVLGLEESVAGGCREPLTVGEVDPQPDGQRLGEERSAQQWATNGRHSVWSKFLAECGHQRRDFPRLGEECVEREPKVRMIAGLEQKMSSAGRQGIQNIGVSNRAFSL